MIHVLIADDHAIVRQGLKQILSETTDLLATGEAASASEVFERLAERSYDVLVLDISMPGRGGLDILKQVRTEWPDLMVLVLSMHPEEQYAIRALRLGAYGYLTKDAASDELVRAIRQVASRRKFVTAAVAERLAHYVEAEETRPLHETLSDREYQVLCKIGSGKTVQEIADSMSLSVKTISTYRSRILEKMHMRTSAELTHYVISHHLLD